MLSQLFKVNIVAGLCWQNCCWIFMAFVFIAIGYHFLLNSLDSHWLLGLPKQDFYFCLIHIGFYCYLELYLIIQYYWPVFFMHFVQHWYIVASTIITMVNTIIIEVNTIIVVNTIITEVNIIIIKVNIGVVSIIILFRLDIIS